eukprot:TRINITY_DN41694_c0_g2_i1.p1 TRINITY_DN41694_c0_g2~~TRINITY_DN41694_c0_g2_i1.p1  ORF type:complete len:1039 (+),score=285.83 TRINITY_DN41694_c0_g2_i1:127-3243(+)
MPASSCAQAKRSQDGEDSASYYPRRPRQLEPLQDRQQQLKSPQYPAHSAESAAFQPTPDINIIDLDPSIRHLSGESKAQSSTSSPPRSYTSLLSRVECVTPARDPASALIEFAKVLVGGFPSVSPGSAGTPPTMSRASTRATSRKLKGGSNSVLSELTDMTASARMSDFTSPGPGPRSFASTLSSTLSPWLPGESPLSAMAPSPQPMHSRLQQKRPTLILAQASLPSKMGSARGVCAGPRWKVCPPRVGNCPSVRAYPSLEDVGHSEGPTGTNSEDESEFVSELQNMLPDVAEKAGTRRDSDRQTSSSSSEGEPRVQLPWNDEELRQVFKKFSDHDDQEIPTDNLLGVLRYLGARPKEADVTELVTSMTKFSSLSFSEFMEFVRAHRELDVTRMGGVFSEADADGSGDLDFGELHKLLHDSHYSPTVEATLEALHTIDEDGNGRIDFEEFERLREHLRITRGFMKAEAEDLFMLFCRVAGGTDKLLATTELSRISNYLGYMIKPGDVEAIIEEVDKDLSGYLNYDELLKVVRGIRDKELDRVMLVFVHLGDSDPSAPRRTLGGRASAAARERRSSTDVGNKPKREAQNILKEARKTLAFSGALSLEALPGALMKLGYYVSKQCREEILETLHDEMQHPSCLTREEMLSFLGEYRRIEGFTKAEIGDLQEVFYREQRASVAGDCDDSLDALELGRVLRWFGISRSLQQVQRMIEHIDFDGTGALEFDEFLKLMRQIHHEEAERREQSFTRYCQKATQLLPYGLVRLATQYTLQTEPDVDILSKARVAAVTAGISWKAEGLTSVEFEVLFTMYKNLMAANVRDNAGYIPQEVAKLRADFDNYTKLKPDTVEGGDMRLLIAQRFPEAVKTKEGQAEMYTLLKEFTTETGVMSFKSFLWITRRWQDKRDELDIVSEERILAECNFSTEEVEGFRQLFSSDVSFTGDLSLPSLVELLKRAIPAMKDSEVDFLGYMVRKLTPLQQDSLRFPQFLLLMRQLILENSFGLNEGAERVLKREEEAKEKARKSKLMRDSDSDLDSNDE